MTQLDSAALPFDTEPQLSQPTITVDRSLSHFIDRLTLDPKLVQSYYDALPFENKPPLSKLTIHFSATPLQHQGEGDTVITSGIMMWDGTKGSKPNATPELPKTTTPTIVVYLGHDLGICQPGDDDLLSESVSETLSHELTHYGQGDPRTEKSTFAQEKSIEAAMALARTGLNLLIDKRWAKVGISTFVLAELLAENSTGQSVGAAAGTAGLAHLLRYKSRQRQRQERNYQSYLDREEEIEARDFEDEGSGLITVRLHKHFDVKSLGSITLNKDVNPVRRSRARRAHKKLALF